MSMFFTLDICQRLKAYKRAPDRCCLAFFCLLCNATQILYPSSTVATWRACKVFGRACQPQTKCEGLKESAGALWTSLTCKACGDWSHGSSFRASSFSSVGYGIGENVMPWQPDSLLGGIKCAKRARP